MSEEYYSKSQLAEMFGNALKDNPEQRQLLVNLWGSIKALPTGGGTLRRCSMDCAPCMVKQQCEMLDTARKMFEYFSNVKETDTYWSGIVSNSSKYIEKYNGHRFAKALARAILEEMSETAKTLPEFKKWILEIEGG